MDRKNALSANERLKGEEEEGKGRGRERKRKGKGEREIGSEALAETEKIANAPAGNRTRDPSKRGWCSTIEPPRQATSPASLFEILSVLPPLHNIGIIQCPQTKPASLGEPVTVAIVHRARPERIVIKEINAKSEILAQTKGRRERKRKGKEEEGKERGRERGKGKFEVKLWQKRKKSQTPQPGIEPGTPANAADALPLSHRDKRHHQLVCSKFYQAEAERIKFRTN